MPHLPTVSNPYFSRQPPGSGRLACCNARRRRASSSRRRMQASGEHGKVTRGRPADDARLHSVAIHFNRWPPACRFSGGTDPRPASHSPGFQQGGGEKDAGSSPTILNISRTIQGTITSPVHSGCRKSESGMNPVCSDRRTMGGESGGQSCLLEVADVPGSQVCPRGGSTQPRRRLVRLSCDTAAEDRCGWVR